MSAAGAPNYSKFQVIKRVSDKKEGNKEKKVDIPGKVIGLNYYESLYSPMVTANFLEVDTGGTVDNQKTGFAGTLKDGLPVEGFEEVLLNVKTTYGKLDWRGKKRRFVIIGSPYNQDESTKQVSFFPMISINAMKSSSKPVTRDYYETEISMQVTRILANAKLPFKPKNIEKTSNVLKVSGNNEVPLDVILKLCPKAVPIDGDPGYFFFENSEGFNFRSIHGMIRDGYEAHRDGRYAAERTYTYMVGLKANLNNNENDFNVLLPPTVRRDQDQINAIKMGQYNIRVCTRNIVTGNVEEKIINVFNNDKTVTLGEKNKDNIQNDQIEANPEDNAFNYCRTYTYPLIPGLEENQVVSDVSTSSIKNNPANYHPRAIMRYGLIHAQLVNIIVPHNGLLSVGQLIKLNIENITADPKIEKPFNDHRSGYYLIMHLCHSFNEKNSFTSLTLCRDTYGKPRKF
tara:strand:+ start:643 stop:2013 length:1371 start_codon:yes stop_codon:yes gene_type:complete